MFLLFVTNNVRSDNCETQFKREHVLLSYLFWVTYPLLSSKYDGMLWHFAIHCRSCVFLEHESEQQYLHLASSKGCLEVQCVRFLQYFFSAATSQGRKWRKIRIDAKIVHLPAFLSLFSLTFWRYQHTSGITWDFVKAKMSARVDKDLHF